MLHDLAVLRDFFPNFDGCKQSLSVGILKNLVKRSLSGIIYVALIVACVILGGWWFNALLLLFTILGVVEFHSLVDKSVSKKTSVVPLVTDLLASVALVLGMSYSLAFLAIFILCLIVRLIAQLYIHEDAPLVRLAYSYMGVFYIALPLGLLGFIMEMLGEDIAKALLLTMFVMIWLNDTGAFLVGSSMGRHKLFPSVSPKKSWEGAIGGVIFSIGAAFVVKYCFPDYFDSVTIVQLCVMGLIVGIISIWGDLVESMIKRTLHVKDSGNLIPGHGGILDRIDSLLLVAPAVAVYFFIIFWCI